MFDSLITAAALNSYLAPDSTIDVKIIDCRFALSDPDLGRHQYQAAHLPGAEYLDLNRDLSSPAQIHGGRHPLPDDRLLAAKLAAIGINTNTLVVAYDDSRFAFAARLWWLLRYYGHDRVAILNGGYGNWVKAGYAVTADRTEIAAPGNFQPQIQAGWTVDIVLRGYVRTIQKSSINAIVKTLKLIPTLSHPIFQYKPPVLNMIKIWRIRWQIPQFTAEFFYQLLNCLRLMKTSIVNNNHISQI